MPEIQYRDPVASYLASLSPRSQTTAKSALNTVLRALQETSGAVGGVGINLTPEALGALRRRLADGYTPSSANTMLSHLRGVLRTAWRMGILTREAFETLVVDCVKGYREPRGRVLAKPELASLFNGASTRDAALLSCLYGAGLRRAEVAALDLCDYLPTGELRIRAGKGNKDRTVYLAGRCKARMDAWLAARGPFPGPLFPGRSRDKAITCAGVYAAVRTMQEKTGTAHFSPHDLRRSFVSNLLDMGTDLGTIRALAGHANIQTTLRYDRRGEQAKREAAQLIGDTV